MKKSLLKHPDFRSEYDVRVLKRCTSFLQFFQKIKLDDPSNRFDSHIKACRVLLYKQYHTGQLIFKFGNCP